MNLKEAYAFVLNNICEKTAAKSLLCGVLKITREDYIKDFQHLLKEEEIVILKDALDRFNKHEPLSKIIQKREFWGLDFFVNEHTLDPRADSETLIELVLQFLPKEKEYTFLELGVGTGCLILSLLKEYPKSQGIGVDISLQALEVVHKNALTHKLDNRIALLQSNWFSNIKGSYDLIISNPPYIPTEDIGALDLNVRAYDPLLALDGGPSGLDPYQKIAKSAYDYLNLSGVICLEIGINQGPDVINIFEQEGFYLLDSKKDLGGIERALLFSMDKTLSE